MSDTKTIKVRMDDGEILELFDGFDDEMKGKILDQFTATQVIDSLAKHLKGESEFYGWSTSGWRWGSEVRDAIAKMQGTEAELRKDFESKLKALEHDREHYKKYYDWYFKAYRSEALKSYGGFHDAGSAWTRLTYEIGDVR